MRFASSAMVFGFALVLVLGCGGGSANEPDHAAGHPGGDHAHHHHGQGHNHDFSDVERFRAIFDDPARDAWQRPQEVVGHLALTQGAVVADVGAGTGYFLPHLSRGVGAEGRVLALDVEPAMVEHMQARIAEAELANAEARECPTDSPGLDPESVDRVLIVDTWHHISEREAYAARLAEALRPDGFVLVVDFTEDSPHGPPASMRLGAEEVAGELEAGGLTPEILEETLPYQYIVRASR